MQLPIPACTEMTPKSKRQSLLLLARRPQRQQLDHRQMEARKHGSSCWERSVDYLLASAGSIVSDISNDNSETSILTLTRHRSLPNLLRKSPTEQLLHQHSNMDHLSRDVRDVLLRKRPSQP